MPVISRNLTEEERRKLLDCDGNRIVEKVAHRLLAEASHVKGNRRVEDVRFPLTKFRWRNTRFSDVEFVDCDLGAPLISWRPFRSREFSTSRFSSVSMDGLNVSRCRFRDCSFSNTVFGRNYYGLLEKSTFLDCRFENCSFSYVGFVDCLFDSCTFGSAEGTQTRFERCEIRGSTLGGRFNSVRFNGCDLTNLDFSDCEFGDSGLLNNCYDATRFPEKSDNYFLAPGTLVDQLPVVSEHLGSEGREWIEFVSDGTDVQVVNNSFYEELSETERAVLNELLHPRRIRGLYNGNNRP